MASPPKTQEPYSGQPYTIDSEHPIPARAPRSMRMSDADAQTLVSASEEAASYYGGDVHLSFANPSPRRALFTLSHRGVLGIPAGARLSVDWGDGSGSEFGPGATIAHTYDSLPLSEMAAARVSAYVVTFALDRERVASPVPLASVALEWRLKASDLSG